MENKRSNVIRIIFWGIITLFLLASGITGAIYNNKLFNNRKNELENITTLFEKSTLIKNYETIGSKMTAKLKGKNIIVTYDSINKEKYTFKLKNGYLETKIKNNDTIGKIIVMVIADSIAMNKGETEGSTYPLFNDDRILKYKLNDGIEYELNNNTFKIKINLDRYLINNVNDNIIEEEFLND